MAPASLKDILRSAFEDCQDSSTIHVKLIETLGIVYEKTIDKDTFLSHFLYFLQIPLIHGENELAVNLTLEFAANFALSLWPVEVEGEQGPELELHPFLNGVFQFLIEHHEAKSHGARFRICQLLNCLLHKLPEGVTLDETLYEDIYTAMLARLHDRIAGVRMQAVEALTRFQDVNNKLCSVIQAFRFHLKRDPHAGVRKAVLKAITVNHSTLAAVSTRCRDVREDVRALAYTFIADKVHVKSLSISQREQLLQAGLKDRHENVRAIVTKKLLPSWMHVFQQSLLMLLKALDVESSVDTCVTAIETILKDMDDHQAIEQLPKLGDNRLIPIEDLNPESALYWRCLASHLHANEDKSLDALESILPEMTSFAHYLNEYVKMRYDDPLEELRHHFIIKQLLFLVPLFDLADEAGKVNLGRTLKSMLEIEDVSPLLARPLVQTYMSLLKGPSNVVPVASVLEIISDLREPLTVAEPVPVLSDQEQRQRLLQIAKIRVQLNVAKENLEQAVRKENFEEAQEQKTVVKSLETKLEELTKAPEPPVTIDQRREERNDPNTLLVCLGIFVELLKTQHKLSSGMSELLEFLVLPCVQHEDPAVRNAGMEALGICCLLDEAQAKRHLFLFLQATKIDHTTVQMTAVKAIFDLVLRYGFQAFANAEPVSPSLSAAKISPAKETESHGQLLFALTELLDSEVAEIQTLAAGGFCKLLLASRIASPMLLSRLLILLYHPLSEEDPQLTQMLNAFLPLYSSQGREQQECLGAAFLPTYKTLLKAPISSPLSELDASKIMQCVVGFTQPALLDRDHGAYDQGESNVHDLLAQRFLQEIQKRPDGPDSRNMARFLLQMQPALVEPSEVKVLLSLCQRVQRNVYDKLTLRALQKFQANLEQNLTSRPSQSGEAMESEDTALEITNVSSQDANNSNLARRMRQLRSTKELSKSLHPPEDVEEDEVFDSGSRSIESNSSRQPKSSQHRAKGRFTLSESAAPSRRSTRASLQRSGEAMESEDTARQITSISSQDANSTNLSPRMRQLGGRKEVSENPHPPDVEEEEISHSIELDSSSQTKSSQERSTKQFTLSQSPAPAPARRSTRASLLRSSEASPVLAPNRKIRENKTIITESPATSESSGRMTRSRAARLSTSVPSSPAPSSEEIIPESPVRKSTRNVSRRGRK